MTGARAGEIDVFHAGLMESGDGGPQGKARYYLKPAAYLSCR
jgi:hypothetical protein